MLFTIRVCKPAAWDKNKMRETSDFIDCCKRERERAIVRWLPLFKCVPLSLYIEMLARRADFVYVWCPMTGLRDFSLVSPALNYVCLSACCIYTHINVRRDCGNFTVMSQLEHFYFTLLLLDNFLFSFPVFKHFFTSFYFCHVDFILFNALLASALSSTIHAYMDGCALVTDAIVGVILLEWNEKENV